MEKKLSDYVNESNNISFSGNEKKIKVAFLCSFTINGIEEVLRVKAKEKNIDCITYLGAYNQYNQEILNQNSALYKFDPDITFLIIDTRTVLNDLFYFPYSVSASQRKDFVETKIKEIQSLTDTFTKTTNSKLIIANLSVPTYSPHQLFETKNEYGFYEMVNDFNNRLGSSFSLSDSVYVYNFNGFVAYHGEKNIFDYKLFFFGNIKISPDYIPYLVNDLIGYVVGHLGMSKKCLVLDLDNTIWGGVVGEDGFNGIKLGPDPPGNAYVEFQKFLLSLHQRGVILAINSKNNHDDALKVIREHPYMVLKEEHFAIMKINWEDKPSNMQDIARELNIGLDSMIFIDDDPVNREYMRMRLPEVMTVDFPNDPSQYADAIKTINELNVLNITYEDTQRGKMYYEQQKRNELENTITDLDIFLKQLNLQVIIKDANEFTIPRISQLTLKTNQFNLTTKRYQESDIVQLSKDPSYMIGCAQVLDKFGDNGITGVFIIHKNNPIEWSVDTFLLSCRIMGREIEKGIFSYVVSKAKESDVKIIKAKFIPTQKNKPVENFLPSCGFKKEGDEWIYSLESSFVTPNHLTIQVQ